MASRGTKVGGESNELRLPLMADEGQAPTSSGASAESPTGAKALSPWVDRLIWMGAFALIAIVLVPLAIMIHRAREAAELSSCMCNFCGLHTVCRTYATYVPGGAYPPLSSTGGRFMFDVDAVYPEYVQHNTPFGCPSLYTMKTLDAMSPEEAIDDHSYYYLGYMLSSEDEGIAFLECYPRFIAEGADFSRDLPAPPGRGSFGGDVFLHFRNALCGDETLPLEKVPVFFEGAVVDGEFPVFHHLEPGGNVIYLNEGCGGIEFVPYPGKFPMTPKFLEALAKLDK